MLNPSDILNAPILIVDDQATNVSLLEQMLSGAGYTRVSSTATGFEVCGLHRQHDFALILLDLQMPEMDGFQVMEALRQEHPEGYLPVLVLTSHPGYRLRALKAGARDFCSKPLDLTEVLLRVRNLIEVRLLNRNLEQLVADRTAQLEEANKELKAFSYSVSHDLRAPLRHVLGFTELLQKKAGPVLTQESLGLLNTISEAAKRMGTLIDDLLAFSQVGQMPLQKTDVNLDNLVRETIKELQVETAGRNIEWQIDPLPVVRGDRSLLHMVLTNLISNAIKFTGARQPAKIEIGSACREAEEVVTFIRDNGAGFDPKYTAKLFGVFQRLHSRGEFEGTGIGLANVRRIIHRHGGRTWAEGVVGGGATFYFSLPAAPIFDKNPKAEKLTIF